MIPQNDIIEWSNTVSWQTNEQMKCSSDAGLHKMLDQAEYPKTWFA